MGIPSLPHDPGTGGRIPFPPMGPTSRCWRRLASPLLLTLAVFAFPTEATGQG